MKYVTTEIPKILWRFNSKTKNGLICFIILSTLSEIGILYSIEKERLLIFWLTLVIAVSA